MSYFLDAITAFNSRLPLPVDHVSWDNITFSMKGENWSFMASGDWVLLGNEGMICGCHDNDADSMLIQKVSNTTIVHVDHSRDIPSYDPIFTFNEGHRLKVFSTSYVDAWVLRLDVGPVFVADPSDSRWNIL